MKKRRIKKLLIALTVIVTIVILSIGMKQKDSDETSPDEIIVPVTKIHETETSLIDFDTLPEIDEILNDPRLQGATTGISIRNAVDR